MQLDDLVKSAIGPVIAICIAGLVGHWLAARWSLWQKRRELAFNAAKDFYRAYGEFFAVWKLWNYSQDQLKEQAPKDQQWKLLERATAAESQVEALLVQLAAERQLSQEEVDNANRLRQAFQLLRSNIRDGKPLEWHEAGKEQYVAFKALVCRVAHLIASGHEVSSPSHVEAWKALNGITSNRTEDWWKGETWWKDVP